LENFLPSRQRKKGPSVLEERKGSPCLFPNKRKNKKSLREIRKEARNTLEKTRGGGGDVWKRTWLWSKKKYDRVCRQDWEGGGVVERDFFLRNAETRPDGKRQEKLTGEKRGDLNRSEVP